MKTFILTRVSSDKQEDGYSLEAQRENLTQYCDRMGFINRKFFELVESATQGDRKEFVAMLDEVEKSKEKVALVCTKTDRLQRGFTHLPLLRDLIVKDKLEIHLAYENKVITCSSGSSDWLTFNFFTMVAEDFTNRISENVKQSVERKIMLGEWSGAAPLGYRNSRSESDKSVITPDPERDFIIRRMFEEFSFGSDTLGSMVRKLKAWGLRSKRNGYYLSKAAVSKMFNNPFYYGEMRIKGEVYRHKYQPIISREVWEKCQSLLHRPARFKYGQRPNLFRGILRCARCGSAIIPTVAKGRYRYLQCSSYSRKSDGRYCENPRVSEDLIIEQLAAELFPQFHILPETRDKFMAMINESMNAETEFMLREAKALRRQDEELRRRIDTFLDLLADGSITRDQYAKKKQEIDGKRYDITARLNSLTGADDKFIATIEVLIYLTSSSADIFAGLTLEEKHTLIKLSTKKLLLEDKKVSFSLASPLDLLVDLGKTEKWRAQEESNS